MSFDLFREAARMIWERELEVPNPIVDEAIPLVKRLILVPSHRRGWLPSHRRGMASQLSCGVGERETRHRFRRSGNLRFRSRQYPRTKKHSMEACAGFHARDGGTARGVYEVGDTKKTGDEREVMEETTPSRTFT